MFAHLIDTELGFEIDDASEDVDAALREVVANGFAEQRLLIHTRRTRADFRENVKKNRLKMGNHSIRQSRKKWAEPERAKLQNNEFELRCKAHELANGGAARKVRSRGDVIVLDKDSRRVESLAIVRCEAIVRTAIQALDDNSSQTDNQLTSNTTPAICSPRRSAPTTTRLHSPECNQERDKEWNGIRFLFCFSHLITMKQCIVILNKGFIDFIL
ncbi:hypothetical protein WR25_14795 [Diploscapter pachys]|uniref:Uncharacterized protein n=1 Tax=Diploscapter pachys TaxID=2018661 RepID=A0A2A2JGE6_9BILA|nr:hypothetical protein WR25_14795 [Diploscapter pachys]